MATTHKGEGLISAQWAEAARAQLARILDSPQFRSSKRCSTFLRYVVEHAAEGRFDSLKERTIGVEVFERDPNYDTNQDPVVRSTAGEVRKRLAQYYTGPGQDDPVRISLPTGSYVAEVRIEEPPPAAVPAPVTAQAAAPARRWAPWIAAVLGAAAIAAGASFLLTRPTGLDAFWSPVFAPNQPLLVCIGQPHVYKFAGPIQDRMNSWFENAGPAPAAVAPQDIVPLWDRYLGLGDIQAFSRVSGFFGKQGKPFEMRGVRSVSLADLRRRPVLLIGAFNNEWTLQLDADLRFYFEHDVANSRYIVRDRRKPGDAQWQLDTSAEYRQIAADYALATRVFNANTEQYVVVAAGITEIGTMAASEFLTTPEYFAEALRDAPSDWRRKNIQVVLSAKVMSGTAGPPRVLAVHFW